MKAAICGVGLRAGHVLSLFKAAMPELELAGFFDPQPTHLDRIGADIARFDSVEAMLDAVQPDLFFVFSPNQFHLEQIRLGLEAGARVFAEKPVVISPEETFALAELLAQYGADKVMVGLVLRYARHMIDLRAALAAGVLGPITSMEGSEHIAPYHGAFFMRDWRRKTARTGGFMLEKCCHDLDLYNMIAGGRPLKVASFGGRRSFLPAYAEPASNAEAEIFHVKQSVWDQTDDPFQSDADIVDAQVAILDYETGCSLAFHTNTNTPDEQRRFAIMGALGMAEGDFVRGYMKVTKRDGSVWADHDYSTGPQREGAHYGADAMMVDEVVAFLRGQTGALPVGVVDALEAGLAAIALDEARASGQMVDLTATWARLDGLELRR